MDYKESKPTHINPNGSYDSKFGTFFKFDITMENGDEGQYSSKKEAQTTFKIGESAKYTFEGGQYPKIKPFSDNPQNASQGKSNYNSPERLEIEKKKQVMIILQSSLKEANVFHNNNGVHTKEEVMNTMEEFAERIMRNKYLKMLK